MPNSRDFVDHVREMMRSSKREVSTKAMFGGHGVYAGGLFVAIVADDVLYLRTDERSVARFDALGLEPFEFSTKDGRRQAISYRRAPDEALESPAAMAPWLAGALDAALRAAAAKPAARRSRAAGGITP
jgi:DNA transformation protein